MGTKGNSAPGRTPPSRRAPNKPAPRPKVSAKVYRRRRLVAAVLALIVIGGLVAGGFFVAGLLGAGPGAKTTASEDGNGAAAKPKPQAKPGSKPSAVCDESGIKVSAAVDKPSYSGDEHPIMTLKVTNTGAAPCNINVGTSQMEYVITSGDDVIFNSRDCAMNPDDLVKNLAPGASETANLTWNLKRSAPDCAPVASTPGRGGATYGVVATLGKWSSERVTFTLQ